MSTDDTSPTPLSQQAAPSADPPSWHGPVKALQEADMKHDARLTSLETGFARLEQKTDAQTVMLGRIEGALASAAKNPRVQAVLTGLFLLFLAWLAQHGIKVEIPQ